MSTLMKGFTNTLDEQIHSSIGDTLSIIICLDGLHDSFLSDMPETSVVDLHENLHNGMLRGHLYFF